MLRITETLTALLRGEIRGGWQLRECDVPREQGADRAHVCLVFGGDVPDVGEVYEALGRLREGEFIFGGGGKRGLVARGDGLVDWMTEEEEEEAAATMPAYVRKKGEAVQEGEDVWILGLRREAGALDGDAIAATVKGKTWMGLECLSDDLQRRRLVIRLGAQRVEVGPNRSTPVWVAEGAEGYVAGFLGGAPGGGKPRVQIRVEYRSGEPGYVADRSVEWLMEAVRFPMGEVYGFEPKIKLRFQAFMVEAGDQAIEEVFRNSGAKLHPYIRAAVEEAKRETVGKLEERRRSLFSRRRVSVQCEDGSSRDIGYEPRHENEVLLLVGRLERDLARLFSGIFAVREHTGLAGIDGLIDIRIDPGSMTDHAGTVEFEHKLESFFRHEHPIRQTKYIVCWTCGGLAGGGIMRFGKGGLREDGPLTVEVIRKGWMRVLNFGDHSIWVLPLEECPLLRVA